MNKRGWEATRHFLRAVLAAVCECVPGGVSAMEIPAKGEVEIGLTFLSEIHDPGVEVVRILPREISTPAALVDFVSTKTKSPEAAKALLKYLSGPEAEVDYKAMGMQVYSGR